MILGKGTRKGDLFWYKQQGAVIKSANPASLALLSVKCNTHKDLQLVHSRLGHPSIEKIKHVVPCNVPNMNEFFREVCVLFKHHLLPFLISTSHATFAFELVHLDLWGPYKVPTMKGEKYFLTILDDFSRTTWTILFSLKDQVPKLIKDFFLCS